MRFRAADIDTYLKAADYVDTALIPLMKTTWATEAKTVTQAVEFTAQLADEMERQFHGRIMQFPAFTYAQSEPLSSRIDRLLGWAADLKAASFSHICLLTADGEWKTAENDLDGMALFFVPALPLEFVEAKHRKEVMDGQLKQLIPFLSQLWQQKV
ncbi:YpiF family protein [Shouchella clausii]|jgi:hypothetical protein|uniref:DUF2487 domain-containing protein n=1 Tax=Shouchella clausii TaxID=79880 RepID=A0A268RZB3_SHOCL|nr:YpiF family protein [Shouchella clausii]PAD42885.1 hypothetical protein CHH54_09390 [Bacillus sp. 7520-S]SPU21764.1 Protein of uncharacterised function (DUF2487) [Niallia circulans]MBU8597707.1 YpiF family protein [Shouchella clausii]MCM3549044.1 YpiF family protein [Shouchella clausii]MCY1104257.1 YpiF family protein [Shouchella clausii]